MTFISPKRLPLHYYISGIATPPHHTTLHFYQHPILPHTTKHTFPFRDSQNRTGEEKMMNQNVCCMEFGFMHHNSNDLSVSGVHEFEHRRNATQHTAYIFPIFLPKYLFANANANLPHNLFPNCG